MGKFPNYEAVLPRDLNQSVELPADQLSQAVQRVSQFSDERSNAIRLRMERNQLRVFSSSAEKGESEDSLETTYGGDPLVIGFNSRYVLDFLKAAGMSDSTSRQRMLQASSGPIQTRTETATTTIGTS